MKTVIAVTLFTLCGTLAFAQKGFTPVFDNRPADFTQIKDDYAWVKGHWVGEHMVGPESSDISCDKKEGTCTDTQANITVIGGTFVMSGDTAKYTVQRWNEKEIVAVIDGRAPCRLRQVLKIDRQAKQVTWMISLAEPIDATLPKSIQDTCAASEMHLELKDGHVEHGGREMNPESKQALDTAIAHLKRDGYTVLVILLDRRSDGLEAVCSETNDPQLVQAMLKTAFERVFSPNDSAKENRTAVDVRPPVHAWEVSAMGYGTSVTKYAPGQEPRHLTSISAECVHGDCDKCSGIFSREDYPGRLIMCVHECHLAQHHDSYIPLP